MFEMRPGKKKYCLSLPVLYVVTVSSALFVNTICAASEALVDAELEQPRFVSLRSDLVNMREGPSTEHGVKWIYHRQGLPMQVLTEYDVWRRVRDMDGEIGWIHVSLLSNERGALVIGNDFVEIRTGEELNAPIIAQVEAGVVGQIESCGPISCRINFAELEGWVDRTRIWGVYVDEQF